MRVIASCSLAFWLWFPALGSAQPSAQSPADDERGHNAIEQALQEKVAELERLQSQVAKLRRQTGHVEQIVVHLQAFEVATTKMRDMGMDLTDDAGVSSLRPLLARPAKGAYMPQAVASGDARNTVAGIFEALRRNQIARALAEPSIVTVSNRPAYFQSGGHVSNPVFHIDNSVELKDQEWGTAVNVTPTLLGDRRIRIALRATISVLDPRLNSTVQGFTVHGMRCEELDAGFEMELGQTMVVDGTHRADRTVIGNDAKGRRTLQPEFAIYWLITPEIEDVRIPEGVTLKTSLTPDEESRSSRYRTGSVVD